MRNRLNLDPVRNLNQLSPAMRFGAYQMTIPTSRSTITEEIRLETPSLKDRTYTRIAMSAQGSCPRLSNELMMRAPRGWRLHHYSFYPSTF